MSEGDLLSRRAADKLMAEILEQLGETRAECEAHRRETKADNKDLRAELKKDTDFLREDIRGLKRAWERVKIVASVIATLFGALVFAETKWELVSRFVRFLMDGG